jgi:hypothetical protein
MFNGCYRLQPGDQHLAVVRDWLFNSSPGSSPPPISGGPHPTERAITWSGSHSKIYNASFLTYPLSENRVISSVAEQGTVDNAATAEASNEMLIMGIELEGMEREAAKTLFPSIRPEGLSKGQRTSLWQKSRNPAKPSHYGHLPYTPDAMPLN